jgi:hypothetical protein
MAGEEALGGAQGMRGLIAGAGGLGRGGAGPAGGIDSGANNGFRGRFGKPACASGGAGAFMGIECR